jgi:hypothetical protein
MDVANRNFIRKRAGQRREYCHCPDAALDLPFHVEHVIASIHRADDSRANLAWACPRCNLRKGTNLATIDLESGAVVPLFNPRTMDWHDHFSIRDGIIVGTTDCGRGTALLLDMNNENRVVHRRALIANGEFNDE